MSKRYVWMAAAILISLSLAVTASGQAAKAGKPAAKSANPIVALETTMGTIRIELFADKAPITAKNFIAYVKSGFYNGTIVHRVDPKFVVCAGGYTPELALKPTMPPIQNESKNGLKNLRGTLSMARYDNPNSATSQFFINLSNNSNLDPSGGQAGYAVFAKVIEGMDVVDKIGQVKTAPKSVFQTLPVQPVIIKSAKLLP